MAAAWGLRPRASARMLLLVLVATRTLRGVRPQTIVPPSGGGAEGYSAEGVSPASLVVQDADGSFDRTLTVDFTSSLREPLLNVRVVGCLPSDETMQPALVLGSKGAKCHVRTLAAPVSVVLKDSTHLHNSTTSSSSRRRHARKGRRRLLAAGDAAHYRLRYEITFEVIDPEATHYVYLRVEYTSMADALMDLEKHRRVADDHSPAVGTEVAGANPLVVPPDVEGWKKAAQAAAARGSKAAREALERGRKVPRLCGPGEEAAGHGHWKHSGDNLWFDPTLAWNSADNVHNGNGKMEADPELDGHPPSTSESATSAAAANANANANAASAPKLLVCDGDEKVCTKKPCVACDHCDPHPGMRPALEAMAAWRWVPRRCVPRRYSSSEAAECLRRVGGVTITGDSVAAQLVDRLRCAVGVPGPFNQLVVHGKSPKGIAEYPSRPWGQFSEGMRKINLNHTRGRPTPPPVTRREKREEGGGVSFGGGSGGGSEGKRGVLALNPAGLWQCGRGTLSSAQAALESLLTPDQVGNYDRVVLVATNTVHLPVASTHVFKDFVYDSPHLEGFLPTNLRKVSKFPPPVARGMRSMTAARAAALNDIADKAAAAVNKKYQTELNDDSSPHMPKIEVVDTHSLTLPREDEPRSVGDARHHGHGVTQEMLQLILAKICPT